MIQPQDDIDASMLADVALTAASSLHTLATQARSKSTSARTIARTSLEANVAHFAAIKAPWAREQEAIARDALAIFDKETSP